MRDVIKHPTKILLRSPVIIFLSDGECEIADQIMQNLCRTSIQLGYQPAIPASELFPDTDSAEKPYPFTLCHLVQINHPNASVEWWRSRKMFRTMSLKHGWPGLCGGGSQRWLRLPIQSNRHTTKPLTPYAFSIPTDVS